MRALLRALDTLDQAASARAARRFALAGCVAEALALDGETAATIGLGAALAEIGRLGSHLPLGPDSPALAIRSADLLAGEPALARAADAVRHHLERWDGTGGPDGLAGEAIPFVARVLALVRVAAGPGPGPDDVAGQMLDPVLTARTAAARADARLTGYGFADLMAEMHDPAAATDAMQGLRTIGQTIRAAQRIDLALSFIAEQAREALGASTLTIARRDLAERALYPLIIVGDRDDGVARFPVDTTITFASLPAFTGFVRGREHLLTLDQSNDARRYLRSRSITSEVAAPIAVKGAVWGMMWASTHGDTVPFDERSLRALRVAVAQAAVGIEFADRLAGLETLALRDPLTGLCNRRVLDEELRAIFAAPVVERRDSALIMIDVDGLKTVNDTKGHAAGDRVLVDTATALVEATESHPDSVVCRIGGDEFCIVLRHGGLLFSDRIVADVERIVRERDATRSVSCGVAVVEPSITTPSALLRAADIAQYERKRARKGLPPDPRGPATPGRRARRDSF